MAANTVVRVYENETRVIVPSAVAEPLIKAANDAKNDAVAAAAEAATSATLASAERAAIAAAIAGYPGGGSLTIPVASRAVMAAIASPAGAVYLYEAGRDGVFYWNPANLSAMVTADPAQGVYVPPASATTGASGAWVRLSTFVIPEMFGATGLTDDLTALRRAGYMAATLKRHLLAGAARYMLGGAWYVGSTTASQPAAGFIDHLQMPGDWKFKVPASVADAYLLFYDATNIRTGDVDFDILTEATTGHGQVRLSGIEKFKTGALTKVGDEATAAGYTESGGSVLSIQAGCADIEFDSAIVEWAGENASAILTLGGQDIRGNYCRGIGGQDSVDLSGTRKTHIVHAHGEYLSGEIIDCGNSPETTIGKVTGSNVANGIQIKTEISGAFAEGSNDFTLGEMHVTEWTGKLFHMGAGVAGTQTLHRCKLGKVSGSTTAADANTRAILTVSGDDPTDPTRRFQIESLDVEMNAGACFEVGGMVDADIANVNSNAPIFCIDNTPDSFTFVTNNRWHKIKGKGDFQSNHRGAKFDDFELDAGKFTTVNGLGNRYKGLWVSNAPADAIDITFGDALLGIPDKDFIIENSGVRNAGARVLRIRHTGTSGPIENIHVEGFKGIDDRRSLAFTSGGVTPIAVGDTVEGATSGATGVVVTVTVTSGSFAAGTAAGTFILSRVSGTFAAENLDVGTATNLATASGADTDAKTSTGFNFGNATFDDNSLRGAVLTNMADNETWGFTGLNSINDPLNRLRDPSEAIFGNTTLTMLYANRRLRVNNTATLTIPADATTVFPIGTCIEIEHHGGLPTIAPAGGVTLRSRSSLVTVSPLYGVARLKKLGADLWSLDGDLA